MRKKFIQILKFILKKLANLTIWRYKPKIIGITGSVGKTSTKLALYTILKNHFSCRASPMNLNNDLGLPLAILGEWNESDLKLVSSDTPPKTKFFSKLFFWLKVIFKSLWQIIFKNRFYPQVLILEYGADRPGDIKYLLSIARPEIAVLTAVGEIPVHVEFYESPESVALEKSRLIMSLPVYGCAILNYDDYTVQNVSHRTKAHILTFGFEDGADIRIVGFENKIENNKPVGIIFKLAYQNNLVPFRVRGAFGKAQAYACAAAAAVAINLGINLIQISEDLENYRPPEGRANLVEGIKNSLIIDDSYNASFLSMMAALDLLKSLPAKRKIAILGDMLEIGKYSIFAHENLGKIVPSVSDVLVTVGPRAKILAESAKDYGLKSKNVLSFETVDEAIDSVIDLIKPGDLILIKASHGIKLYKLAQILRQPE